MRRLMVFFEHDPFLLSDNWPQGIDELSNSILNSWDDDSHFDFDEEDEDDYDDDDFLDDDDDEDDLLDDDDQDDEETIYLKGIDWVRSAKGWHVNDEDSYYGVDQ